MAVALGQVVGAPTAATAMAAPAPAAAPHIAPSPVASTASPPRAETVPPAVAGPALAASPAPPQATTPGEAAPPGTLAQRLRSFAGLLLLTFLAWGLSTNRSVVNWRIVLWGLGLQLAFAFLVLRTPAGAAFFEGVSHAVEAVLHYAEEGAGFVFGELIHNNVPVGPGEAGTNAPLEAQSEMVARTGAFFAFNVLPTIIFVSSLMTVLYHVGVMQWVVRGAAWVMRRTMGTTGAETLSAAANIFVGQLEAPLVVKPYVQRMTVSELNAVMAAGMATISGSTLAAYVGMLSGRFPDIAGHLIAASVMSAPAALVAAKLMVPETGEPVTRDGVAITLESPDVNVIDAAARGAAEGLRLCLNIAAMIVAFLALVYMADGLVSWLGGLVGLEGLTLSGLVGMALRPVTWIVGVPWADAGEVGRLFGLKTVLNEFVAYLELAGILEGGAAGGIGLQPRSALLASYALAGFANFGSVAMLIGALGEMAPDRRHDLARVGLRAMVAGAIAALMTAAVAGMLV